MKQWMILVLVVVVGVQLAACSSSAAYEKIEPIHLEAIEGSEYHRMVLTERAAERLGIQTVALGEEQVDGTQRTVIPYSALLYGLHGKTYAYTSPEPLTYVKEEVTVDYIKDDMVVLTEGPVNGTEIVTIGVAELYGADTGVGQ